MRLSQLLGKSLILDKTPRGVCVGVGVSLKNKSLKYLFCRTEQTVKDTETALVLPIDALASISENALYLSRLRPILPKSCIKLSLHLPVYNAEGNFLGRVIDAEFQNYALSALFTDTNARYPVSAIGALADAVILRKPQPYPIGQPLSPQGNFVTKQILRKAVNENSLIQLTLSLPPFEFFLN